jgi:hypothetical protein
MDRLLEVTPDDLDGTSLSFISLYETEALGRDDFLLPCDEAVFTTFLTPSPFKETILDDSKL